MTGRGGGGGRRVLLPPINFLFRLLQQRTTVQIWLYEQLSIRIVGTIRVSDSAINGDKSGANTLSRDSMSL
jgi:small nuclear ribonucleoprotein E